MSSTLSWGFAQAGLDVVRAGNDPKQARIGRCLVPGILDRHAHFAPGALQAIATVSRNISSAASTDS
jgi:predicted amidohydrolase YtcJ